MKSGALACGKALGGGRGVGIGVTWNAKAGIRGNLVRRYWKGIGLFVDAEGTVVENIIEDILARSPRAGPSAGTVLKSEISLTEVEKKYLDGSERKNPPGGADVSFSKHAAKLKMLQKCCSARLNPVKHLAGNFRSPPLPLS